MKNSTVRVEPIKAGFAAYSDEWGIAAAGPTEREALDRLTEAIALFIRLAAREQELSATRP